MSFSDLHIKSKVRAALSRHWVDLTKIGFDCCMGTVRFRGELWQFEGHDSDISEVSLLEALELEIKRIPGVRKVYFLGVKLGSRKRSLVLEDDEVDPTARTLDGDSMRG